MLNKRLILGIIVLFITTSINPIVFGFISEYSEKGELLDNLAFIYNGEYSSSKFEYISKLLWKDYLNNFIIESNEIISYTDFIKSTPIDSPWPMKCYNLHHTSQSPYSTENVTGLEKWRFRADDWINGGMIIGENGTIYFGDFDRYIYGLYPNGMEKWRYGKVGGWIQSTPALSEDGGIYVGSWDAKLYAISPNGTLKWKSGAGGSIASSPVIAQDGIIYVGTMSSGNSIVAFYPNGTRKWIYETGSSVTGDPSIGDDGTIYCGSGDTYFYALNPNGTLKWRFKTEDYVKGSSSIGEDGIVYIGSFDDYLYALYPNNGTMKWRCKVGVGTETNPSIASDGTIYVGGNDLYAIYPNGTKKWTFNPGDQRIIMWSSPAISADGTIYFGTNIGDANGGEIIAVNPDGTEKWRKMIADEWVDSSPCIGEDGTVYIGSASESGGYLHAFGPVYSNSPPDTPSISGEIDGEAGKGYWYEFIVNDPDLNPISFYIDWGDGNEGWKTERASGEKCYYYHKWIEEDTYTIRTKAKDILGEESDWAYLEVTMPKSQNIYLEYLERFPILHKVLEVL